MFSEISVVEKKRDQWFDVEKNLKIFTVKSLCNNDSSLGEGGHLIKVTTILVHNVCNMQHRWIENLNINQYPVKNTETREDDFSAPFATDG